MQPISTLPRPGPMPSMIRHPIRIASTRLIAASLLAITSTLVPTATAQACSCAFTSHVEAIAAADVAFIGTVTAREAQPLFADPFATTEHAFEVTRSKAPMQTPFALEVASGGGASCGLDMSIGEEWVVIASAWEDGLQTSLCSGSMRAADFAPGELARIEDALPHDDPDPAASIEGELFIPTPVIIVAAVAALVASVSLLAFRRDRVS
jgi:hypothetical protein